MLENHDWAHEKTVKLSLTAWISIVDKLCHFCEKHEKAEDPEHQTTWNLWFKWGENWSLNSSNQKQVLDWDLGSSMDISSSYDVPCPSHVQKQIVIVEIETLWWRSAMSFQPDALSTVLNLARRKLALLSGRNRFCQFYPKRWMNVQPSTSLKSRGTDLSMRYISHNQSRPQMNAIFECSILHKINGGDELKRMKEIIKASVFISNAQCKFKKINPN